MGPNDIEEYFSSENIREKAKYIYLKEKVTAEERRRIKASKVKVLRFLEFFNLADPFGEYGMLDDVTELLIISCLQSILLDKQNEIFDYKFYGYEGKPGKRTGKIHVHAVLKNDGHIYDALKVNWVRRVVDRSYANVGDSEMRKITSRFEKMCIETLIKILNCSTISEMLAMSNFYAEKLEEQFAVMQIAKVSVELSHSMGIAQYKTATRSTEKATTRGQ